ncbi:MAG: PaaI family thioesterase [Pseudomonadota bacterium]
MKRELAPVSEDTVKRAAALAKPSAVGAWFGTRVELAGNEHLYRLTFDEPHIGNPIIRALHGGVISAFMEYSARLEVLSRLENDIPMRSISVHTSYLRGSHARDFTTAISVKRMGRRIAFVEASGWQGEREELVATAQIAFRLLNDEG